MKSITQKVVDALDIKVVVRAGYMIAIGLITYTLITEHHVVGWTYILFPFGMIAALLTHSPKRCKFLAFCSFVHVLLGGAIEPLELGALDEAFLLLPLCYLVLFPGTIWPMLVVISLIAHYFFTVPSDQFPHLVENTIELLLITTFATVMTYYKRKFDEQLKVYRKESLTDFLTQLPNRRAFYEYIETHTNISGDSKDFVLLKVDIDNFKEVNESFGQHQADMLLKAIAEQLKYISIDRAELFRLEGDEFVILLTERDNIDHQVSGMVRELMRSDQFQFELNRGSYQITFSAGISSLKKAANNHDIWLKNVDIATQKAKSTGKNRVRWYDESLLDETIRTHQIESQLEQAIKQGQFELFYQPKVTMNAQCVNGAEALIRWQHPVLGTISPAEFIAIAEQTKQIIMIGRWVIRTACLQAKQWADTGHPITISVNVSTVQFAHDDLFPYIRHILRQTELDPHLLQIEITETTLMKDTDRVTKICRRLQDEGVTIAIDDFGVAYSSLNYLKHLPIDVLKIDKSFVDDCVNIKNDHMLVKTIIQLGHNMGKKVIAEGVEYEAQRLLLVSEGCHEYQGYLFSQPVSAEQFTERFMQKHYMQRTPNVRAV
ncbi:putative bifunctional diguanylate cyclase/phosphodiesterase [Vibrio renipiscarius]|uniref:putative bifunctional diguanylate cyclase/phosphodiesterase n=1 Tax=Vibrio renipiscarius TaxID=1461322 RepID=UPI00355181BB